MLEEYFVKPATIDRVRGSWIAAEIENYLVGLVDQGYSNRSVWRRVPITFALGEFARERGASGVGELPAYVEAFVADRVARHHARTGSTRPMAKEVRGPVEQMLCVVVPGFEPTGRPQHASPSPMSSPASSTAWSRSVAFARSRFLPVATTSTASRPTCRGSTSRRSAGSSRRRSSARSSSNAPAREQCSSIRAERLHSHVLRHSCAMTLIQAGSDTAVMPLWLGHADIRSTNVYSHADMTSKQRALALTAPASVSPGRYRPTDSLLAFLEGL